MYTVVKISLLYTYFTLADGRHITIANPSISQKAGLPRVIHSSHQCWVRNAACQMRDHLTELQLRLFSAGNCQPVAHTNPSRVCQHSVALIAVADCTLFAADDFIRKRNVRDAALAVVKQVLNEYKQQGAIYSYTHQIDYGGPGPTGTGSRKPVGSEEDLYAAAALGAVVGNDK
eukprot:scaffold62421_cov49-Prasinocladus_malaysianus.AAC.1